ncbi:DUF4422 domain-containing protein [Gluconacetobacter johannae]|uniref:DUF4422 domain-containing protein n=1 Tax=Gluconacetobacter johannae TaxID=112140 RepID=A0A7W4P557_9PROT|nr:DUF4422 domain-containing protein [Gluconacetobacter johannae]MBB2175828.1 DUF4422 domain-containing protein [Gluconacetobacter johannae]
MTTQIYIAMHKETAELPGRAFVPIQVGRADSRRAICEIGDDTGDNISTRNASFCELTALYWIWRNTSGQGHVGLFHYRRHLNFSGRTYRENEWGVVDYPCLDESYIRANALTDEHVDTLVSAYDMILPKRWDVRQAGSRTMWDHYQKGGAHRAADYDAAIRILTRKYPDYARFVAPVNADHSGYFTNIFVMRRDIFDEYCSWIFDILFDLEKEIDLASYSLQETRVFGYISEWLFNIFVMKYRSDHPDIKVRELERTLILDPAPRARIAPVFSTNAVPVVLAFNNNFVPYAGACIQSILNSSKDHFNYDLIVMNDDISDYNKSLIEGLAAGAPNVSIRFVNPRGYFADFDLKTHMHFSKETYYRLSIPEVFENYGKILYIDADMIVRRDLADLLRVDLGGKAIGAVRDCVMTGFRKFGTPALASCGGQEAETYVAHYLGLADPAGYFQAGILVFDLQRMPVDIKGRIRAAFQRRPTYWFLDQDILNIAFQGHVHYLDMRWNVFHGNGNVGSFFKNLPLSTWKEYESARRDPYVVHFAGEQKPWLWPSTDFAECFWMVLRQTPWYETTLLACMEGYRQRRRAGAVRASSKIVLKKFADRTAPVGTRRRGLLRRLYRRVTSR